MSKLTKKARKRSRARRGALPGFGEPVYDMIDPEPPPPDAPAWYHEKYNQHVRRLEEQQMKQWRAREKRGTPKDRDDRKKLLT